MKKVVACTGAILLCACGGPDPEMFEDDPLATVGQDIDASELVGTYRGTGEDGVEWASTLDADGTYRDTVGGEVAQTGTWTSEDGQLCFSRDVGENELPEPDDCFGLGAVGEDGTVVLTTPEGEVMSLTRDTG